MEDTLKLPLTQEELDAYVKAHKDEAYKKGLEKGADDSQSIIAQLESKVALVEKNPLSYPRIVGKKGEVFELPFINPIILEMKTGNVRYEHDHFTNDEAAKATFDMSAAEVLADVFKQKPEIFIKK